VDALAVVVQNLYLGELGLRVGAPFAPQRAAFQKDGGPHAWPVVNREFLNVKDNTLGFHGVRSLPLQFFS
jgi:hypothetical protein